MYFAFETTISSADCAPLRTREALPARRASDYTSPKKKKSPKLSEMVKTSRGHGNTIYSSSRISNGVRPNRCCKFRFITSGRQERWNTATFTLITDHGTKGLNPNGTVWKQFEESDKNEEITGPVLSPYLRPIRIEIKNNVRNSVSPEQSDLEQKQYQNCFCFHFIGKSDPTLDTFTQTHI